MSAPPPARRWRSRLLVAAVVVLTLGTLATVVGNSLQLRRVTDEVKTTRVQSINVTNTDRECLLLLQMVTDLGETVTTTQVDQQRGLLVRQLSVSIASFPADSAQVRELAGVRSALLTFPWERLTDPPAAARTRLTALALVSRSERRINALRSGQEKYFYSAASEALDANERSQVGLSLLVAVVIGLGILGVAVVVRRSRSDLAKAFDELTSEMTERKAAELALRTSEARFRSLVQRASDLTVVTDKEGVVTYVSPSAESLLGYRPAELQNRPLLAHVAPEDRAGTLRALAVLHEDPGQVHTVELRLRTADGRVRLIESVCQNLLADPDVGGLVWNGRDVTDRRALEDRLSHQASHDPLTGLPNRTLLIDRLVSAIGARSPAAGGVAVILLDLDGFKSVNDTLGHAAGDELLRVAATRLLGCIRAGDTAARLGGDEFAVVAAFEQTELAVAAGQRLVDRIREPFTLAEREVRISASVGIAHSVGGGTAEELLRDADIAMYVAKNTGKGRVEVFEAGMRERAAFRISMQQDLARSVDQGEIEVHYQPIIDLRTMRPCALEGFARWRRPDGTLVPASVFVPIAEESGAIVRIGEEVLRRACRAVQLWRAEVPGCQELAVGVNVSAPHVLSGALADHVRATLEETLLPPRALILEITEGGESADAARIAVELRRVQELGVRIAVDDFGSGQSSLGFLLGVEADALKIDQALLDFDTRRQGSMVTAIAELGRTLGLSVVAEGVETAEHLRRAREAQCDAAQGYHFGDALPFAEVAGVLRSWPERPAVPDIARSGLIAPADRAG